MIKMVILILFVYILIFPTEGITKKTIFRSEIEFWVLKIQVFDRWILEPNQDQQWIPSFA